MMERSPLQYLSKTFTRSSKVTLPNIRKGLVKVTFPSHLQYLNGSLSKSLRSLKVYFRAVLLATGSCPIYGQCVWIHLNLVDVIIASLKVVISKPSKRCRNMLQLTTQGKSCPMQIRSRVNLKFRLCLGSIYVVEIFIQKYDFNWF